MFSRPLAKLKLLLAVAVLGAVAVVGGAIWLLAADDDQEPASALAFYTEYTLERNGRLLGDDHSVMPNVTDIRWWYESPDKTRYEYTYADPWFGRGEAISALNGMAAFHYDWASNTYRQLPGQPSGRHPMGSGPISPTWASLPAGPLGYATVDEAVQSLARGGTVSKRGEETLLGRKTAIYVIDRPSSPAPDGIAMRVRDTYWLASDPPAILKAVADTPEGPMLTAVVTRLEYRRSIDDDTFTLKQPDGSLDVSGTPQPTTSSMGESIVPAPFLSAPFLPDGFRWSGSSGSPAISHRQEFRSDAGGYLKIDQRYRHGGWPQNVPMPGTEMPYARMSVWVVRESGPLVLLGVHGDIIVRIEAEGVAYSPATSVLAFMR